MFSSSDIKALTLYLFIFMTTLACGNTSSSSTDIDEFDGCQKDKHPKTCEVFALVNQERSSAGVDTLTYNNVLAEAARLHAVDMVMQNYFDHTSLDGRSFSKRATDAGYAGFPTGENIAAGQRTASSVMNSWMTSPGHKRNILASGSKEIGIGVHNNYWVQVFGTPK